MRILDLLVGIGRSSLVLVLPDELADRDGEKALQGLYDLYNQCLETLIKGMNVLPA